MHEDEAELSPEVMRTLDGSRGPRAELEDVVVARLGARGVFPRRAPPTRRRRGWRLPVLWMVSTATAAAAAFVMGTRASGRQRDAIGTVRGTDGTQITARVRAAGAEYIRALAQVDPRAVEATDAAMATFRTASDQMMRIAPGSDLSLAIGMAFPSSFARSPAQWSTIVPAVHLIRF